MKFSILHPSRGRAKMAYDTFVKWVDSFSDTHQIEYILSIDEDDRFRYVYVDQFKDTGVTIVTANNRSVVDAANQAAKLATGDCLILVSDDFECPTHWDIELSNKIRTLESEMYAIQVDDGYSYPKRLLTIPIMSKALYKRLGYVYNPIYFSMWVDNDLYETCDKLGVLATYPIRFQHNHYANGRRPSDQTDQRHGSTTAFKEGQRIFKQRELEGFPV